VVGLQHDHEAIACRLPVVTTPGKLMRAAFPRDLTNWGDRNDRADADAYVEIAVRLGLDSQWRADIVERMAGRHAALFSDRRPVVALEKWYRDVLERETAGRVTCQVGDSCTSGAVPITRPTSRRVSTSRTGRPPPGARMSSPFRHIDPKLSHFQQVFREQVQAREWREREDRQAAIETVSCAVILGRSGSGGLREVGQAPCRVR